MKTTTIVPPSGFRLAAANEFYAGFAPGSGMAAADTSRTLTLSFRLDGDHRPIVVALQQETHELRATWASTRYDGEPEPRLRAQLARMLGLDVDGAAWAAVGERDPIIGSLQRGFPGFFTAAKSSPYDAATWAVLQPRTSMTQAARWRVRLAEELGDAIELAGKMHHVFPAPDVLANLPRFDGIPDEKVARLRGVGAMAANGYLERQRFCAMSEDDALRELQKLRGVGPWAASHIYYRGVAPQDALPTAEPRVLHGLALAYGMTAPTLETYETIAEAWRPFRMWCAILISRNLARTGGWHAPELQRERAAAGKRLQQRLRRR